MTHDVSDDEIWSGLGRCFAAGERLISRPEHWRERNLDQARPVRRPTRLRMAGAGSLVGIGAAVVLVAVVLGPGSRRPSVAPTSSATVTPGATATPTATRGQTLTATQDGLSITVVFDRTRVEPAGKVAIDVTVHNDRSSPATYFAPCPGTVEMDAAVPLPLEPAGRSWTGIEADLKAAALGSGGVPGESPTVVRQTSYAEEIGTSGVLCSNGVGTTDQSMAMGMSWKLRPGQTFESKLVWTAELESGVPALPGDVPLTIALMGPLGYPPTYVYQHEEEGYGPGATIGQLNVTAKIEVVGQTPKMVSKGQAVDAVLADPTFAKWLAEQPKSTWSGINLDYEFLNAYPVWWLDVYRGETDRTTAKAFIDPYTGKAGITYCVSTNTTQC
jgi:hypothetical protein